jgi:ABC-type transport system substrate-binding protein
MLHEAEPYIATRPALLAAPGFAILLAVLGWNRVADGLRDALDTGDRAEARSVRPPGRTPVDLLLAAAALLLLSLSSPAPVAPPRGARHDPPAPQMGGIFRGATAHNLRSLDPAIAYDEASGPILQLVFARLVTWDARGEIVGDLASAFTISPDGRTYTFTLRDGARFHDGAPVLARDVARSLERLLHPRTASPAASQYAKILGYEAYHEGRAPHLEGVRVLGERLVAVELAGPDATFLSKLTMSFAAPVCASAGPSAGRAKRTPCGAGPFQVVSWDADRGVRLSRHEGYGVPGRPYLDGVEWSVGVPSVVQRYRFERGEIDYVTELSGGDRDLFLASPAWAGLGRWIVRPKTEAIFLNTEVPPFDRREIRRAVALAIDPAAAARMRADLVDADRVVPPSIPGPLRDQPMRRHDLPAALDAMARAGFPFDPATGRGGWPSPIDYLTVPDSGDQQVAEVWQQQLARVGLRLRLRLLTFAACEAEAGRRGAAPMGRAGWYADYPDPSNFFEPLLGSAAIQDDGSTNRSFFSDPELDALLARAHSELDPSVRSTLYLRAEEIVRDEAPWIPTHGARAYELWQPYVHGYPPHPVIPQRFADVWIDRDPSFVLGSVLRGRR